MKFILGLTGQTGAGKTLASTVAKNNGFFVIDCDKVAHTVLERQDVKNKLVAAFGQSILENEKINRKALAKEAFATTKNTELLNKTVLPFIVDEIDFILSKTDYKYILLDAPTLFESGADKICALTVGIIAEREVRKERIIKRDNITEQQALMRINAGKPDDFYKEKCDYVLDNSHKEQDFINNFEKLLKDILIRSENYGR